METYTPINWEDSPSTATPITAENLNHMEDGIQNTAAAITEVEADVTAHESQIAQLQSQVQTAQTGLNAKADKATTLAG